MLCYEFGSSDGVSNPTSGYPKIGGTLTVFGRLPPSESVNGLVSVSTK